MVFKKGNKFYLWRDPEKHKDSLKKHIRNRDIRGDKNPNWRKGKIIRKGYRYIYCPEHPNSTKSGYILEHRLVMEVRLGRLLQKREVVHHVNGDKLDNRIGNLQLFSSVGTHVVNEHCQRDEAGKFV